MPDLFTHAVIGYLLGEVFVWRRWFDRPKASLVAVGTLLPELVKIRLIFPSDLVEFLLGVPFSWDVLATLGGSTVTVMLGVLLLEHGERLHGFLLLELGSVSHLFSDALLRTPTGHSYPVLWPLTRYRPPTPGLYLSTDSWLAALSFAVLSSVFVVRFLRARGDDD